MMSKLFVAALVATVAASKTIDLTNYTFDQYLQDFNLKFHPSEIEARRANFLSEVARVRAHNAKNLSWKEEINQYSVLTHKERDAFRGRHAGVAAAQGKMLKASKPLPSNFEMKPVSALPREVDWRTKGEFLTTMCFDFNFFYTNIFVRVLAALTLNFLI